MAAQIPFDTNPRASDVTIVHKTACKEMEWHIARLPKTSAKACFAQQAITKKKCEAKIVQGNKPIAAPTYTSVMQNAHKKRPEIIEFFFAMTTKNFVSKAQRKSGYSQDRTSLVSSQ